MLKGMPLDQLAREVEHQSQLKEDYVVDTRELTMLDGHELSIPVGGDGSAIEHAIMEQAHRQIAGRLSIPWKYYERLRTGEDIAGRRGDRAPSEDEQHTLRGLLDLNVNTLLRTNPERRMIRTFSAAPRAIGAEGPIARAFLSDRYRHRDNDELLAHVLPVLGDIRDANVVSASVTDSHLYVKVVAPRVEDEVIEGDPVQAGVLIKNSEVGMGALTVQPFVYRLVCLNGMVVAEASRYYHIGRQLENDDTNRVLSDETRRLGDQAFFATVADVVRAAVDETRFNDVVMGLREARTGERIKRPVEAVERVTRRFSLTDGEGQSILAHLVEGGDLSCYGLMNAVTRAAQDTDSYDRSTEMEVIGGQVLELAGTPDWNALTA